MGKREFSVDFSGEFSMGTVRGEKGVQCEL